MANSIETVWKLILDEKEARQGENMIQRLARLIKEKLGGDASKAIDKTTDAIEKQTRALKDNEAAAKKSGNALSSDTAGKVGGAAGKLRGIGDIAGAGGGLGILNDVGDAVEGLSELGSVIGSLNPVSLLAIGAIAAIGLAIATFVDDANKQAEKIDQAFNAMRDVMDEVAGGATTQDIEEQIAALQFRRELEKLVLEEAQTKYQEFVEGIREAFGIFAPLVEGILKIIHPAEEALATQIQESEKRISESEIKENQYRQAIEKGLTAKADAAAAEEELQEARDEAARDAEKAAREREQKQKEAQREQEQAAAEQQRQAEQLAQKQEQIEEKRLDAGRKYSDALVDIATSAADDAKALVKGLREGLADNDLSFRQDLSDMSADFHHSEREEELARMEEEAADLRAHANKLTQIRDDAFLEEEDLLRSRDFLGATKIRERANREIEQENKALLEGMNEKQRLQKSEDAQQLREFDKARRERFTLLQRANAEAQQQYRRDVENQKEARKIAEREAKTARDRELREANDMARALLGIHQQTNAGILQMGQAMVAQLRGIGSTTNNNISSDNRRGNFGTINLPMVGGSSRGAQGLQLMAQVGLI